MTCKTIEIKGRSREQDLRILAYHFFINLIRVNCEYGAWGLDGKRPFGNSDVEGNIITLLGIEVRKCKHCNEPIEYDDLSLREYSASLYDELGDYLKKTCLGQFKLASEH